MQCFAKLVSCQVTETHLPTGSRPQLVRSRTLPAIVVPGISVAGEHGNDDVSQRKDTSRRAAISNTTSPIGGLRNFSLRSPPSPGLLRVPNTDSRITALSRLLSPERPGQHWTSLHDSSAECSPTVLRRSTSIDSVANHRSSRDSEPAAHSPPSPGTKSGGQSPAGTRRKPKDKLGWRQGSMEVLVDGLNMTKAERKRLEKLSKINIHLHALYAAVEHNQLEKARAIIKTTDVDVNSVNGDGFSLLDIAVMTNNQPMARLLLTCGAQESSQFLSADSRCSHLQELVRKAQKRVDTLSAYLVTANGGLGKQTEKQKQLWERRLKLLNRMKVGFDQTRPPDPPGRASVDITGPCEARLRLEEPDNQHHAICTKYKVQWSTAADFGHVTGECDVTELVPPPELPVRDLTQGQRYHFRAAAGNFCGWSRFVSSVPAGVVPSVWRDADQRLSRLSGKVAALDRLFGQIRQSRPDHASDLRGLDGAHESPNMRKNVTKKKSIKNLFQTAVKFQKHLRSGVYLASVLYHEDRVAMTTEEFLPVLEVDDSYPSSIHADFHWLMKVGCTWDDVRSLRQDMERSLSSSSVHFRIKLLAAAEQMQSALGVQDLGQLYYRPLRDAHGALVFVTISHVRSGKLPSASVRWQQVNKLQRKVSSSEEEQAVGEQLITEMKDIITYHMVSSVGISRGLHLGYLQCQTSVDLIRVSVARNKPNVLPHVRVRENPHVSSEEWAWLTELGSRRETGGGVEDDPDRGHGVTSWSDGGQPVTPRSRFRQQVETAVRRLLKLMDVPAEQAVHHRLYNAEVLELNSTTSFLLLIPPADQVCSIRPTEELTAPNDCLRLPVQIFEMVHMMTYQRSLVSRYSRISSILETDTTMAQHASREAFSAAEISETRGRLAQLQTFQADLEAIWRTARWLTDAIAWARDKTQEGYPLSLAALRSWDGRDVSVSPVRDAKRLRKDPVLPPASPAEFRRSSSQRLLKPRPEFQKSRTSECLLKPRSGGDEARALLGYPDSSSEDSLGRPPAPPPSRSGGGRSGLLCVTADLRKCSAPDVYVHAEVERVPWAGTLSRSTPSVGGPERLAPPPIPRGGGGGGDVTLSDASSLASSARSLSSNDTETDTVSADEADDLTASSSSAAPPGVLQVYAAYETGLAAGTSVRLHVTPRTCAREVVDLVVKQLNMAVVLKGRQGPVYAADQLRAFCLVAVIGARERCLRDDFRPLQLQNPWKRGKLFVRRRADVLAAIQQNSAARPATAQL